MSPANLVFCMDIGGTRTKYGLVNLANRAIAAQIVLPTETSGPAEFIQAAELAVIALCQQAGVPRLDIMAGGAGIPGYTDGDFISLVWEALAFMEGKAFRPSLEAGLGFPILLDNDARVVAMGEAHFGGHSPLWERPAREPNAKPHRLLSLTLGTGLGVAMVIDGKLQEQSSISHMAGHFPIRPGASPCFCGFSGCLESLVGEPALIRNYRNAARPTSEAKELPQMGARAIFLMAADGSAPAIQAVRQVCDDLVVGLNAYIYLYGPDVIVLGGGVAQGLRDWLPLIREGLFAKPYSDYQVQVVVSTLGEQAGLYGAASLWDYPDHQI
jgi:glucokinase